MLFGDEGKVWDYRFYISVLVVNTTKNRENYFLTGKNQGISVFDLCGHPVYCMKDLNVIPFHVVVPYLRPDKLKSWHIDLRREILVLGVATISWGRRAVHRTITRVWAIKVKLGCSRGIDFSPEFLYSQQRV